MSSESRTVSSSSSEGQREISRTVTDWLAIDETATPIPTPGNSSRGISPTPQSNFIIEAALLVGVGVGVVIGAAGFALFQKIKK